MANHSKNARAESRLEKVAREGASAMARHEADAQSVRKKTARLRTLRLAKEAADMEAGAGKKARD